MPPKLPAEYTTPRPFAAAEAPYRINHAIPPVGGFSYQPLGGSSGSRSTGSSATSASTAASVSGTSTSVPYNHPRRLAITNEAHVSDSSTPSSTNKENSKSSSNDTTPASGSGSNNDSHTKQDAPTIQTTSGLSGTYIRPVILPVSPTQLQSLPTASTPSPCAFPPSSVPPLAVDATPFEIILHQAHKAQTMPGPGLSYFEARRALWSHPPADPPAPASPSPSRVKLEALLSQPGAVESEEVWRAGLKNVWKGLVGGNQLRQPLPLNVVLKILQAGWLRDGTWPEGLVAPAWEDPPPPPPEPPEPAPENATLAQREEQREQQEAYVVAAAAHARQMQEYIQNQIPPGYSPSSGDLPESNYYAQPYAYAQPTPPPQGRRFELRSEEHDGEEEVPPSPQRSGDVDDDDDDIGIDPGDGRHEGG